MIGLGTALPLRGADGLVMLQVAALAPPVVVAAWFGGVAFMGILVTALIVALAWDFIFAALRHRPFKLHGIPTAAIFAFFVPAEIPLWHLIVVLSLGTVFGEHIFGGRGFSFASPATVALALVPVSLPNMALVLPEPSVALACLPGAVLLMWFGALSVPIAIAFLVTIGLAYGVTTPTDAIGLIVASSVSLVFLVCDPLSASATGLGRLLYGVLAGGLAWLLSGFGGALVAEALVFAALLASLFAPLIDTIAIAINGIWRRRRYD